MKVSTVISLKPDRTATIKIDGVDISYAVTSLTITANARRHPEIELHLASFGEILLNGSTTVRVTDEIRTALLALGWTPPEDGGS